MMREESLGATVLSPEKEILSLRRVVSILQKRIEKLVVDNHRLTNLILASQWTPSDGSEQINPLATQELIDREFQDINNEIMQKMEEL